VGWGEVVVFLGALGVDGGGHGDRLLLAALRRVLGCPQHLRAGGVELHRRGPQRAAQLGLDGGAGDAVMAVLVAARDRGELVAGELLAEPVVRLPLVGVCAPRERSELEQRLGGGRAVEVAVEADRALVGALHSLVVGVEVVDEADAAAPQRQRPVLRHAVGVAAVGQQIADLDAAAGRHAPQHRDEGAGRVDVAAGDVDAAHEFGHLGAVLVTDDRDYLCVVAEEALVPVAGNVAAPVSPGGLGSARRPSSRAAVGAASSAAGSAPSGLSRLFRGVRDQVSWSVQSTA
jgi:hypothetical protein